MPELDRAKVLDQLAMARDRIADAAKLLQGAPTEHWDSGLQVEVLTVLQVVNKLGDAAQRANARFEIAKAEAAIEMWKKRL